MKIGSTYRKYSALGLLISFLFVFLVKDFHSHDTCQRDCTHKEEPGNKQNEESCHICHFLFSPFIVFSELIAFEKEVYSTYPIVLSKETTTLSFFYHYLRAPPLLPAIEV